MTIFTTSLDRIPREGYLRTYQIPFQVISYNKGLNILSLLTLRKIPVLTIVDNTETTTGYTISVFFAFESAFYTMVEELEKIGELLFGWNIENNNEIVIHSIIVIRR